MYHPTPFLRRHLGATAGILFLLCCTEPFQPENSGGYESALVVDAKITNEFRKQEVFLSRALRLEADTPRPERNAQVQMIDDQGNTIRFEEASPGSYVSETAFAALPRREYRLQVVTRDTKVYESLPAELPAKNPIDSLYAERIINDDGQDGMAIFVDAYNPEGDSRYYHYDFEETYKIIAPLWRNRRLIIGPAGGLILGPQEREERVCYTTDTSHKLILTNTHTLNEDRIKRFMVRFINRDNYIISHRYSILVKQYILTAGAYNFYETLSTFSSSESLLSESQPGFFNGNIVYVDSPTEKVLGYFTIATVSSKRIFFDYTSFFPGEALPPYVNDCRVYAPSPRDLGFLFLQNQIRYISNNDQPEPGEGPYFIVPRVCGDCTVLGDLEPPDFWVE